MKTDKNLKQMRDQIDKVDNQILDLLAKRFEIVKKVGKYKIEKGIPFFDAKRKKEIIMKKVTEAEKRGLPAKFIKNIYKRIHDIGLALEIDLKSK